MKKLSCLVVIFAMSLSACSSSEKANEVLKRDYTKTQSQPATSRTYLAKDTKELEERAEYIILGKALNQVNEDNSFMPPPEVSDGKKTDVEVQEYIDNHLTSPIFVSEVAVLNVYKGELAKEKINVLFNYAVENDTFHQYEYIEPPVYEGLNYTYFLHKYDAKMVALINKELKTNYEEVYYIVSCVGLVNADDKDKENLETIGYYLGKEEVAKIISKYSK